MTISTKLFSKILRSVMLKKLLVVVTFLLANNLFAQTATAPSGTGTSVDPYLIATLDNLYWITQTSSSWSKYFKQTADIDASSSSTWAGGGFLPIGNTSTTFTGTYDGNGHTISGLTINRGSTNYVGMFGYIGWTAGGITKLGLINLSISGSNNVGGLAGYNYSIISYCYTSGAINGNQNVGGICGSNYSYNSSKINNSYSHCTVNGSLGSAGGFVGGNSGSISNCYSTGAVSGTGSYVGGFCGFDNMSTFSNCFWDNVTSGQSSSHGGTGKTTSEMKTQSTFTGWDFTTVWSISSGVNNGYPYLQTVSPLPVELSSFTASVNGSNVNLKWLTATEVNNYGFQVERKDGRWETGDGRWEKIGFVAGSGNSNSPKSYSFTDQPSGGTNFSYRLKQIDNDGHYKYYDAITVSLSSSTKAKLMQNSPNPFNPSTAIKFFIPDNSDVTIKIYDMLGREVTTLINQQSTAGYHIVYWNGRDSYGRDAASGVYLYRLTAGNFTETRKMNLLK